MNIVQAEDAWNPFKERDEAQRRRPAAVKEPERPTLPPLDGIDSRPWARQTPEQPSGAPEQPWNRDSTGPSWGRPNPEPAERPVERQAIPTESERQVERTDLAPVLAGDGSGLPAELWQGVDAKAIHTLVTRLEIPPRSPALHDLWRRLWTSGSPAPLTSPDGARFEALRVEALYRSGLLRDLVARLDKDKASALQDPLYLALAARARVAAGDLTTGCEDARALARSKGDIPKAIRGEMLLIGGYCAIAANDLGAAGLAADLVRAEGIDAPLPLAALDAVTAGQPFKPQLPKRLSLMDYRFLAAAKSVSALGILEPAEPALLVALATDAALEPRASLRVKAAEQAARLNALDPEALADVYRAMTFQPAELAEPAVAKIDPALRRALFFKSAEAERTPQKRSRVIRSLLDDARRDGLYWPVASMLARAVQELVPAPEIGWFAETAVEVGLLSARYDLARTWITFAGQAERSNLQHWMVLVDLADSKFPGPRGASLIHAEQIAIRGRLAPEQMHRLATVLDALDYQIPIPLWEAASRTPQPTTGHLPETGVLTELQDAAKKKEFARTVLLALQSLGPDGADRAHMIALGDAVRALRRAGLDTDARRLALEAVFAGWPRASDH